MSTKMNRADGHRMDRQFISIQFQSGQVAEGGVNGCRVEDVIDALTARIVVQGWLELPGYGG